MAERRKPEERRRNRGRKAKMVIVTKKNGVTIVAEGTPEAFARLARSEKK